MTPRPNATRIGLFALGGIALLVAAIGLVVGGRVFADTERAVMHFSGSVQGLQIGSSVVLRGVRLGTVRSIGLVSDGGGFRVPVIAEIDHGVIRAATADGGGSVADHASTVAALVERGLTARLATQSLLTGQLYVDLEMRPASAPASAPRRNGLPEIPTAQPLLQVLQAQLEKLDIVGLTKELQATLGDARTLIKGPEIRGTLAELTQAAAALARLSGSLERRVPVIADKAQSALAQAGQAAGSVGQAAERIGAAAVRADTLLAPGSPMLASVQQAADELTRSAAALRQASGGDSPTVQQLQQALDDVGRAARAVRQLAELVDRQPEVLLRGRSAAP